MDTLFPLLEVAAPLMAGALTGTLFKTFVFPKVLSRLGPWAELVNTPANRLLSLFFAAALLGLAVLCHSSNAEEALAWLRAHPGRLPFQPTPFLLQVTFHGAAFFCAYQLAAFPDPSPQEDGDAGVKREGAPAGNRRSS
ncbi:hypothetical protein ACN28I_45815 [Archangium gephyra]|uniref:hypothetical protein n=1 Tax=Archangium gephyra TaxID=48 RepID=UPI003B7BCF3E